MHAVARAAALSAVLAFAVSCSDNTPVQPTAVPSAPASALSSASADAERTPFQQSVAQTLAERQAKGLPVPTDVSYTYTPVTRTSSGAASQQGPRPGDQVTIVARTVIHFDHPSQAGNLRWPDLVVEGEVPPNAQGFIHPGDYSQSAREYLAREVPGIWSQYEFGLEPRTYTFVEEYKITYPAAAAGAAPSGTSVAVAEILMGFTVPGPNLDYTVDWSYDVAGVTVIDFVAGFRLDWGLGLRLPVEGSLTSEEPLSEGSTYWPTSTVHGLDWSADDYVQAGVAAEDGNEFVMRFVLLCGVFLEVSGIDVMDYGINENLDRSSSFTTPFGSGATFSLPSIDVTIWDRDVGVAYGQIGFRLTPQVGSDKFTADWAASGLAPGKASGSGSLLFTNPSVNVPCGPLAVLDGPGFASVEMNGFRYYFDNFLLDLSLFFYLDVFGVWDGTFTIPITDFDLSAMTGNLYVGPHSGTPSAFAATIAIENVAPTAQIDLADALTVHGTPAFFVHAGNPLELSGRSVDPGFDDLTLSWDWDDGVPSPDVSTLYPVPYDITETQMHAFGVANLYSVRFESVDDDGASNEHLVPVIVTGVAGTQARFEGYWQHQCRGNGHVDYEAAQIEGFLDIIDFMSAVFSEVRDISSAARAFDVLFLKQNGGSAAEQLDRELLVAWLNFAAGAFDPLQMLDTDHNGVGDRTFIAVVSEAETVRLDPNATEKALARQAQILHHIEAMAGRSPGDATLVSTP